MVEQTEKHSVYERLGLEVIRLDLPFRLDHVNVLLAEGSDGWTVMDTGLHDERTVARWDDCLGDKHVSDILISHYHPDHFGYAGGLQAKTGARVSMSETDANNGMTVWQNDFIMNLRQKYRQTGIPEDTAVAMTSNTETFTQKVTPYPHIDHYFIEDEKVRIGPFDYEVIFTPGHSDGMVVFYNEQENVLLATDHILQHITPNIAYWFHGIEDPLKAYLASLQKIKALDADLVIPCHGDPFHGANERIDDIITHHDHRLAKTLDSVKDGSDIYTVTQRLFRQDLNIHEMRFAVGETIAHLEYLRHRGELQRVFAKDVWFYEKC